MQREIEFSLPLAVVIGSIISPAKFVWRFRSVGGGYEQQPDETGEINCLFTRVNKRSFEWLFIGHVIASAIYSWQPVIWYKFSSLQRVFLGRASSVEFHSDQLKWNRKACLFSFSPLYFLIVVCGWTLRQKFPYFSNDDYSEVFKGSIWRCLTLGSCILEKEKRVRSELARGILSSANIHRIVHIRKVSPCRYFYLPQYTWIQKLIIMQIKYPWTSTSALHSAIDSSSKSYLHRRCKLRLRNKITSNGDYRPY